MLVVQEPLRCLSNSSPTCVGWHANPKVGRAEALRRSMLALIDKGAPHEAHPTYWAPYVLVCEGGSGKVANSVGQCSATIFQRDC